MNLKKKLLFGLGKNVLKNKNTKGYLRKVLIGVTVMVFLFTIAAVALIGYSFNQVSGLIKQEPNVELVALEDLISGNKLILSEEQEAVVIPLLTDLVTNQDLAQEEAQRVVDQILNVLTPLQLEELNQRSEEIISGTKAASGISLQVAADWFTQYTGLSFEKGQELLNSVLAWWEVKDPSNEAPKQLLDQIKRQ